MTRISFVLLLITVVLFAACSKKSHSAKVVVPKTSYNVDIVPLLQAKCTPCHLPTKGGRITNFENYENAKKYGETILARIQLNPGDKGFMPFKHAKLPAEEIAIFKKWIDDGSLEK